MRTRMGPYASQVERATTMDYARRKHASCAHVCARMGPYASQVEKATTTRDASSALPSGKSAKAEAATRPAPTGACSVSICAFVPVNQLN